jgi:MFS family permease
MKEKIYVDRIFADYENTQEINDFKEEITVNLTERIRWLVSNGVGEDQAFEEAAAELGDITAIADEAGKKLRNETIGQMYINAKVPITKRTAGGITLASGFLLLAIGIALISFFQGANRTFFYYVSSVFLSIACGLYTYFGLTQETTAHYAMKKSRAVAYGITCITAFLGAGLAFVSFFSAGFELSASVFIKAVFIVPAICAFIYLLVTEQKRQKPWLKALVDRDTEKSMTLQHNMVDPVKAAKFGVASGGLWIFAIAVFLVIGFMFSWQYSWLVFPFTLAIQVFMITTIFVKK